MEQAKTADGLTSVVDQIFGEGLSSFTLSSGKVAEFHRAKVSSISKITEFFSLLLTRVDKNKIDQLLALVIKEQTKQMNEGKSVYEIDFKNPTFLNNALDNSSLILTVFGNVFDELPKFAAIFTNLTAEDLADLELDEFAVVGAGIFAANYAFFTQNLPPILRSLIGGVNAKRLGASTTSLINSTAKSE